MKKALGSTSEGFTLLEVLVSLSIMAIVLVAVFKLHAQSITMTHAARFHTMAPLLMQTKLSDIKATPLEDLVSDSGDFGETFAGYTWQFTVEGVESEPLGAVAERLKKIHIGVAFDQGRHRYAMVVYHFFQ